MREPLRSTGGSYLRLRSALKQVKVSVEARPAAACASHANAALAAAASARGAHVRALGVEAGKGKVSVEAESGPRRASPRQKNVGLGRRTWDAVHNCRLS